MAGISPPHYSTTDPDSKTGEYCIRITNIGDSAFDDAISIITERESAKVWKINYSIKIFAFTMSQKEIDDLSWEDEWLKADGESQVELYQFTAAVWENLHRNPGLMADDAQSVLVKFKREEKAGYGVTTLSNTKEGDEIIVGSDAETGGGVGETPLVELGREVEAEKLTIIPRDSSIASQMTAAEEDKESKLPVQEPAGFFGYLPTFFRQVIRRVWA